MRGDKEMKETNRASDKKDFNPKDYTVMIVEDSMTQLTQLLIILENAGFNVATCTNGIEALKQLDTIEPDLVLTDINMPGIDGYELCKRIKSDPMYGNIPVILLTYMTDPEDVIKGLKSGADNFIPKPFSEENLISRIRQLLNNRYRKNITHDNNELEVFFAGTNHSINNDKIQILDLLLSTFESAVSKNNELLRMNSELGVLKYQLVKKNSELLKLSEEKSRFVGIAAHDIRNPLSNIYSFADLLRNELEATISEKHLNFLEIIKKSSQDLLTLVNELLDVSQIESGKIISNFSQSDIIELIKNNVEKNGFIAEKKSIKIDTKLPSDQLALYFDYNRIDQVVDNLLSNAIKYSEQNTTILLELKTREETIEVTITDQGVGIDQKEINKMFEPFVSLSSKTTGGEPSTGLGLFTCKKIIDTHKGEIYATSKVGEGTVLTFTLPRQQDADKGILNPTEKESTL